MPDEPYLRTAELRTVRTSRGYCAQLRLASEDRLLLTSPIVGTRAQARGLLRAISRHVAHAPFLSVFRDGPDARAGRHVELAGEQGETLSRSMPLPDEAAARELCALLLAVGPHVQIHPRDAA